MVNRVAHLALELLLPQHCLLCREPCPGAEPLCPACRSELPANTAACDGCALPLPNAGRCGSCQRQPPPWQRAAVPWLYTDGIALLLKRWKFQREHGLTPLLAGLWQQGASGTGAVDALVPVPMHWWRRWRRGYNQAELLALALAPGRAPVRPELLRRRRHTPQLAGLGRRQRRQGIADAFTAPGPCDNLRLALVDDVLTTGATAAAATEALYRAGAAHVELWCLARTPAPRS